MLSGPFIPRWPACSPGRHRQAAVGATGCFSTSIALLPLQRPCFPIDKGQRGPVPSFERPGLGGYVSAGAVSLVVVSLTAAVG